MLKIISIIIVLAVAAVLIFAASKPDNFRVQRSIAIKAPPEKVFAHLNDFHHWEAWSPWEKIDPAVIRIYGGAENGVGATYAWKGNSEIGQGRMAIIESAPPSKLLLDIEFIKPFAAKNKVEFILVTKGGNTVVTQAMYGPSPYISKLMSLFFNMDKMVGDKYEQGLASLKLLAEK
jgi:uncharacterized protein YndB with AHSA1/START domain